MIGKDRWYDKHLLNDALSTDFEKQSGGEGRSCPWQRKELGVWFTRVSIISIFNHIHYTLQSIILSFFFSKFENCTPKNYGMVFILKWQYSYMLTWKLFSIVRDVGLSRVLKAIQLIIYSSVLEINCHGNRQHCLYSRAINAIFYISLTALARAELKSYWVLT